MKRDYPMAFLEAWAAYPRREPDNPKKLAWKAWQARVNEGEKIADLLAATKGYAASIRQRRLEGTERVLQAATFYGPNERWQPYMPKAEPILVEKPKQETRQVEERIDGLPFLQKIIQQLAEAKKSPFCTSPPRRGIDTSD